MTSPTMVRPLRKVYPSPRRPRRSARLRPCASSRETTRPSSTPMSTTSAWMSRSRSCRSSVRFMTSWYFRRSACALSECTAGPLPRFSIRYWIQAASAALAISAEGVQLPDEVALPKAAYGRVAGACSHRVEVYGKADRLHTEARRGQRGLYPGVARAYNDYIAFFRVISSHNL